ncbi:MAG: hypothetical protein AB1810_07470 [Pseudomonadota bacterium]
MSKIINFPMQDKANRSELEKVIDKALANIPERDRKRLKFELIKTIDGYDSFFTEWSISLPKDTDKQTLQQLYDIAHREHARKMRMLADIVKLKIESLVNAYQRHS